MAKRSKTALDALRRVSGDSVELFDRIGALSDKATSRSSEALVGVAGGSFSLLLGYGASIALPAISFGLIGPIAVCVGIPFSILVWRGRTRFRIERQAEELRLRDETVLNAYRLRVEELRKQRKALAREGASQSLLDALDQQLLALTAEFRQFSSHPTHVPLALPPPTEKPLALPPPGRREQEIAPIDQKPPRTPRRKLKDHGDPEP